MRRIPENQYTFFDSRDLSRIYNDFPNRRLLFGLFIEGFVLKLHRQRFDIGRQVFEIDSNEAGFATPVILVEFVATYDRLMLPGDFRLFPFAF